MPMFVRLCGRLGYWVPAFAGMTVGVWVTTVGHSHSCSAHRTRLLLLAGGLRPEG
jgi:hypothetical protein